MRLSPSLLTVLPLIIGCAATEQAPTIDDGLTDRRSPTVDVCHWEADDCDDDDDDDDDDANCSDAGGAWEVLSVKAKKLDKHLHKHPDDVLPSETWTDPDGDGWGSGLPVLGCPAPDRVDEGGDCDDSHAGVNPGAPELCGDLTDNDCDRQVDEDCAPDAVDCEVGAWVEATSCEDGVQGFERPVFQEPAHGGAACPATWEDRACAQDCEMSAWSGWSDCDPDSAQQERSRTVLVEGLNGGEACGATAESMDCAIDCVVSWWGDWSACVDGVWERTRTVVVDPTPDGLACPYLVDEQTCVTDCLVSDWTPWSACDPDEYSQFRSRTVLAEPSADGTACPALEQEMECEP